MNVRGVVLCLRKSVLVHFYVGIHSTLKGRISMCTDRERARDLTMVGLSRTSDYDLTNSDLIFLISYQFLLMCLVEHLEGTDTPELRFDFHWAIRQPLL